MTEELIAIPVSEYERLKRIEQAFIDMLETQKQELYCQIAQSHAQNVVNQMQDARPFYQFYIKPPQ